MSRRMPLKSTMCGSCRLGSLDGRPFSRTGRAARPAGPGERVHPAGRVGRGDSSPPSTRGSPWVSPWALRWAAPGRIAGRGQSSTMSGDVLTIRWTIRRSGRSYWRNSSVSSPSGRRSGGSSDPSSSCSELKLEPELTPVASEELPGGAAKPPVCRESLRGERRDSNPRPPGPQPGRSG